MQIEPPETIHFPIHSLQELQEQRGGLRVSALGSATVPRALAGVFSFKDLPLTSLCTSQVLIACEKRSKLTSELVSF